MAARNGDINEFNPFAFTIISLNELDNTYESQFYNIKSLFGLITLVLTFYTHVNTCFVFLNKHSR